LPVPASRLEGCRPAQGHRAGPGRGQAVPGTFCHSGALRGYPAGHGAL